MVRRAISGLTAARAALLGLAVLLVGYLAVLASWPHLRDGLPAGLRWFGQPNSAVTIAIVVAVLTLLGLALSRSDGGRRPGAPVAIVAGLALISTVLGMASYWRCRDDTHPTFFTPLNWTAKLVKGSGNEHMLDAGACPAQTPVALEVAQVSALAAVFLSVVGVAMALFQARLDRLRVFFAPSVTAVVGLDDDGKSMITAIVRTRGRRGALVVVTDSPDRPCVSQARNQGARIVTVDFARPQTLTALSLWRKLDALYLLSPDPSVNLSRLDTITEQLPAANARHRVPLIVRIDDPWQATAWRAKQFDDADRRWAADAVGRYEVTARRLLDRIVDVDTVNRVLVCGTSQLTLALCAEFSQRQLERDYYGQSALPEITLIAADAEDFQSDHEYSRRQLGLPHDRPTISSIPAKPTVPLLMSLIDDGDDADSVAVVFVDTDALTGVGTRLAARYPATPTYAWDPAAHAGDDRKPLVGRMRTYQLTMDLPDGQPHDAWELAARLIHERYARPGGTPATRPWPELSEFYKESNRRQVRNALWMVESIGGHTWNTWGSPADSWSAAQLRELGPAEQLSAMGFDHDATIAMARAEHEDWCRFYRRYGWSAGDTRDDGRKIHPNLIDWSQIDDDPEKLDRALSSLAATLSKLRELGYRSRPVASVHE